MKSHLLFTAFRIPALAAAIGLATVASSALALEPGKDVKPLLNPQTDEPGLKVGEKAPSVKVVNAQGEEVDLGQLYKEHAPIVLTFYRGGWCPFCNKALKEWSGKVADLKSAGGTFVAISPETIEHALETEQKVNADWITLIDADGVAIREFRVGFAGGERYAPMLTQWNASSRNELPAPSTYIIDADGVIRWAFNDWDYKKRANPDDVIAEVRKLKAGKS